ncbi:MAG: hypothetical protein A3H97_19430 [Acidobacteria bacterium RIFCSPLOWO2_02_FULL_65_29]|nr:MAG: hypothetical protein A3H97_19430 [Acidobacteria bacterium RIFCSPLOWO2_02_FULL_65_29]
MAGVELTSALARLLSDRTLRLRFNADRGEVARELELTTRDAAILCAVDAAGLEAQAQTLLDKRRSEATRIMPRTWKLLAPAGTGLFEEYASDHWPTGHLRHPMDALAFMRFLVERGLPHDRIERLRMETRLSDRRRRISVVPSGSRWKLPALYVAWLTPRGWSERLVHVGPRARAL